MAIKINKITIPVWLIILSVVVFIIRIPYFFEPYSYGDEMIYLTLGQGIRKGLVLYRDIYDNKPPLLYLTAALAGNLFWFKTILSFWNIGTIILFWKLVSTLFKKTATIILSTIIFALLTSLPLFEGNIANAELFMIGFSIASFYILLKKQSSFINIFIAGILFSLASLFKMPAAFDVPAIIIYWIFEEKITKARIKLLILRTFPLVLGFLTPHLIVFGWTWINGSLKDYLAAAFSQNVGYLSSWRPDDTQKPFYVRNAPLLIRVTIILICLSILWIKRNLFSKQFIFLSAWLLFSLFAVTLSERPYPHYFVQSLPAFSIMMAMLFTIQNFESILVIIPLTLTFFVPIYYKFWYYQTSPYYFRFYQMVTGKLNVEQYRGVFGSQIPIYYSVSQYIADSTKSNEKIFVWGDNGIIYSLTRRVPPIKYVADYHIKDFAQNNLIIEELNNNKPVFIIVTPDSSEFPELNTFIGDNYALAEEINGVKLWRLLSPKVRGLIAH